MGGIKLRRMVIYPDSSKYMEAVSMTASLVILHRYKEDFMRSHNEHDRFHC